MTQAPVRPRLQRRTRRSVFSRAAVARAAALILAVAAGVFLTHAVPYFGGTAALSASSARSAVGLSPDFVLEIRTSLATQYETTVLLEKNDPVSLVLECNAPAVVGYEPRVQWRCDRGRLEREDAPLRNRFFPPPQSALATIEAEIGFYPQRDRETATTAVFRKKATLRVISPSPASLLRNGQIDGFKIGDYLSPTGPGVRKTTYAAIHPEKFLPPRAFYLVDDTTRRVRISRHLRLGDFAMDYPWFSLGKRQYVALDYGLVRKFEDLIDEMNRAGLPGDKFCIIYGFRPPAYNTDRINQDGDESLKAPFSMHQYGKAIDFVLDADGDLKMDDLDGDGKVTVRDTGPVMHCVNVLDRRYRSQHVPLYGGAGIYDHHDFWERPVQSPYVHVDTRGFLDEEGALIRWPAVWPDTKEPIAWGKL